MPQLQEASVQQGRCHYRYRQCHKLRDCKQHPPIHGISQQAAKHAQHEHWQKCEETKE
jgi:hypothetical protein